MQAVGDWAEKAGIAFCVAMVVFLSVYVFMGGYYE